MFGFENENLSKLLLQINDLFRKTYCYIHKKSEGTTKQGEEYFTKYLTWRVGVCAFYFCGNFTLHANSVCFFRLSLERLGIFKSTLTTLIKEIELI